MNNTSNNQEPRPELLLKLSERIQKETPRGRGYARLLESLRILLLIGTTLFGVVMLSLFLADVVAKIQGVEFEDRTLLQNIPGFLLGFLFVSMLSVCATYVIYRGSDWPFVKERFGIFAASFLAVVLLSSGTVFLSENELTPLGNYLDDLKDSIEASTPIQAWLGGEEEVRTIAGVITSVEKDDRDWVIVVESHGETEILTLDGRFGAFSVGDRVRIQFQVDGEERDVETIERR